MTRRRDGRRHRKPAPRGRRAPDPAASGATLAPSLRPDAYSSFFHCRGRAATRSPRESKNKSSLCFSFGPREAKARAALPLEVTFSVAAGKPCTRNPRHAARPGDVHTCSELPTKYSPSWPRPHRPAPGKTEGLHRRTHSVSGQSQNSERLRFRKGMLHYMVPPTLRRDVPMFDLLRLRA